MKVFESIQKFFNSIGEYVKNFSYLFLIFIGAFVLISLVVIIITSFSYETMLTKTIDRINKFLEHNPRINDDNLVAFNNMMKASSVPKALRRQWQQFMLYREHPASYYMSFQHCVENPLRNSVYKQQMSVYKVLSYVLSALSLVVSIFMATQAMYSNIVLQDVIIIPVTILIGYWAVSMVLDLIHNATSSDLFQNYQYFEINMDKAMLTLPDFVDYEVLFSQDEIRKGIPVLFAYLQKRAVQEQQELEKARLTTINHEKFNFDEAGLDGSLVLDRAMRETENFASQRKKYMQETERVNNEITALENNYKEQIKEYQRQVQTSKETVDNLKEQLEQATSTIEINYIKKQIRDEINRQQLAEKDFDTTTDKYNQETRNLNQEIKQFDDETKKAKRALENAMMSEFESYSVKVYNNLGKVLDEKMREKVEDYRSQITTLENQLEDKNDELENIYTRYQEILAETPKKYRPAVEPVEEPVKKGKKNKKKKGGSDSGIMLNDDAYEEIPNRQYEEYQGAPIYREDAQPMYNDNSVQNGYDNNQYNYGNQYQPESNYEQNQYYPEPSDLPDGNSRQEVAEEQNYIPVVDEPINTENEANNYEDLPAQPRQEEPAPVYEPLNSDNAGGEQDFVYVPLDDGNADSNSGHFDDAQVDRRIQEPAPEEAQDDDNFDPSLFDFDFKLKDDERPQTDEGEDFEFDDEESDLPAPKPARRVGRPRKVVSADDVRPKRPVGRPRKTNSAPSGPKRSVGRPRKTGTTQSSGVKRPVGRPRKNG